MKITLIGPYPPFRGGISDFNYSLSIELKKHHDVQIINFTTQYPNFLFPGKTQYKTNNEYFEESNRQLSSVNCFSWSKTAKSIIDFKSDLVIFQYWMPFFIFSYNSLIKRLNKKTRAQIISICHNLTPHEDKSYYNFLTKRYLKKIDKFVVMSKLVEDDLLNFKRSADFITAFHPIYDLFGDTTDKQTAKSKINVSSKNILLFFGLIREYKGLDILLKSIPIIKEKVSDFKLIVAGECYEDENKYRAIIGDLDISENVIWHDKFIAEEDVSDYFCAADVVVLPYKTATQSGVAQIAYNFDRPVIISNVGGLSEIVEDGITGYVVEPYAEGIADAIITYFEQNKFEEFSQNIKRVKNKFSWESFTNNLLDFSQ